MTLTIRITVLACALALTACGGGGGPDESEQPIAGINSAVADDLAARADEVAAAYGAGDICAAARLADELNDAADQAVEDGAVSRALVAELDAVVSDLVDRINCPRATGEDNEKKEEKEKDEDGHNGKGKGKGKGQDGGGEDLVTTVVTEETQ